MTRTWIIFSILVFTSVCWLNGCSEDCPTCPTDEPVEHYKGWLYFTDLLYDRHDLYKVDMETDSVVDSFNITLPEEERSSWNVSASPDGRYLAVSYSNPALEGGVRTRIYDAHTMEMLRDIDRDMLPLGFALDGSLIALTVELVGSPDLLLTHIFVLAPGTFEIASVDTISDFSPLSPIDTKHNRLFGIGSRQPVLPFFWVYDYSTRTFDRIPVRTSPSDTNQVAHVAAAADGDRLFFVGRDGRGGSWLGCWSIDDDSLLWKRQRLTHFGGISLTPDETELWSTDPGFYNGLNPGTIYIHDAHTGSYLGGISLRGYFSSPYSILTGAWIVFSPTGERAYVGTGLFTTGPPGSVLVVSRSGRVITKLLAPNLDSAPAQATICPKT